MSRLRGCLVLPRGLVQQGARVAPQERVEGEGLDAERGEAVEGAAVESLPMHAEVPDRKERAQRCAGPEDLAPGAAAVRSVAMQLSNGGRV